MDKNVQNVRQRELEAYSGLLKKYKTAKNDELASTSVHHLSKNSSLKQSSFSKYNIVKNSSQQFGKHTYNKFNQSYAKNSRTVLYNNPKHFKSKYKLTANKTVSSPFNTVKSQIVSNRYPITQCKKIDLCSVNSCKEASKLSPAAQLKTSSSSHALIKEIESLTEMLKKTSENNSKSMKSSIKGGSSVVNKLHSSNFKYCAITKHNILKNESKFSKINDPFKLKSKIISSNINATVELKKKSNSFNEPHFATGQKNKNISANINLLSLDKYSYKKVNAEKCSKITYTPLKTIDNGKNLNNIQKSISQPPLKSIDNGKSLNNIQKSNSQPPLKTIGNGKNLNNIQKSNSQPHLQKVSVSNVTSVVGDISCNTKNEIKPLSEGKLKLGVTTDPIMSRTRMNSIHTDMHKLSSLAKINGSNTKYKRVNANHSVILSKNYRLKNSHFTSPSMKKAKGKLNSKFKIINKNVSSCVHKKTVLEKSSIGCKENSPLVIDQSDPVYKLLNDSTVDKIEEDLLAIKSTLTSTPMSARNYKGLQNRTIKIDPKRSHRQMSFKKSRTRISKYQVINSIATHSSVKNNKQNFMSLKNIKKTKFSIINKHISATPIQEGKSVLIKRLFKNRNTIINKNVSPTHHSAKMIKCKYFALNKRKLPFEKPILYSKGPFLKPKFKGYLSTKLYAKKSRPQKAPIMTYSQRKMRKFSPYVGNSHTTLFNRHSHVPGNNSKKKLHHGYGKSPVVFIRGLKYSLNSSGKTLRKLPIQDFPKIHQNMAFNAKRFAKIPENRIKAMTPTTANLASRVLHRSITRVLSASSKKKMTKVNSYCMFYNRFGRCNKGVKCTYIHDPSKIAICTRYLRGTCKVDGCPFSHEITPGKMAICSFFLVGACDKDDCPYRHENLSPDAELCKAFVQGYCPCGKECKKAHVLICPKYIQGNCEKGASCAFPHPPQKGKKNALKENEEESKLDDALLEKVARYFQPNENASLYHEKKLDGNVVNVVVPKQRRLEEQPSFIPLSDSSRLE